MFRLVTVFMLTLWLAPLPARSEFPEAAFDAQRDAVRAAEDAEDFAQLEAIFSEAHKAALAEHDFRPLRSTYATFYVSVNAERRALAERWLAAYPDSPYAATALGWQLWKLAWEYRGDGYGRYISAESWEHFHRTTERTQEIAGAAFARTKDFLPLTDLMLQLRRVHANDLPVAPLVASALKIAPGRHVLLLGLSALHPNWGGSLAEISALCAGQAPSIPDYSEELCFIDATFHLGLSGIWRETALSRLEQHDEPFLDYARLDAYVNEWRDRPEAAQEAMRIARNQVGGVISPSGFEDRINRIGTMFHKPAFYQEMREALIARAEARRQYSPQDGDLLYWLAETTIYKLNEEVPGADPKVAFALWQEMMPLRRYQGAFWRLGTTVDEKLNGAWDLNRRAPFFENAIAYSNHAPNYVIEYLMYLDMVHEIAVNPIMRPPPGFDKTAMAEASSCLMVRVIRIYDAVCAMDPNSDGCHYTGQAELARDNARALLAGEACRQEREAPVQELAFAPREVSIIVPPAAE